MYRTVKNKRYSKHHAVIAPPSLGTPESKAVTGRLWLLFVIMLALLLLFSVRLAYLQFVHVDTFRLRSQDNYVGKVDIVPLRGKVLARDGTVLADSRLAVDLVYRGGDVAQKARIEHLLGQDLVLEDPDLTDTREKQHGKVVIWDVDYSLIAALEELMVEQPVLDSGYFTGETSLYVRRRKERFYPTQNAAHLIGYTREEKDEQFFGVSGIEGYYNEELYGVDGEEFIEIDNKRRVVGRFEDFITPAEPGKNIVLTIDLELQAKAEKVLAEALPYVNKQRVAKELELMDQLRGAIVAMDPNTGEILALASYPSYDPHIFTKRPIVSEDISGLLEDTTDFPMLNRAVSAFPPASTFKLLTSYTLMDKGHITSETVYPCAGQFYFRDLVMRNWAGYSKGSYNVKEAIADSCNTFYFNASAQTPDVGQGWSQFSKELTDNAKAMGYGSVVGIGVLEERAGLVPDDEYSRLQRGFAWRPGDTLNISIGQGDLLATPVQVTQLSATIAMDGKQYKPHLVRQIGDERILPSLKIIEGQSWRHVRDGMRLMMTDYGGRWLLGPNTFPVSIAGKTGTAQNGKGDGFEHSWFTGFGPVEKPEVVVTVFIENGGSSSAVAIPIARDFLAAYWNVQP